MNDFPGFLNGQGAANADATGLPTTTLTISSDTDNYNIFTEAGSPSGDPVTVHITINTGINVGSTSSTTIAMYGSSALPVGSELTIINNGKIGGAGGAASVAGGTALKLPANTTIDNTNGEIFSGGTGGAPGATGYCTTPGANENPPVPHTVPGGAGGQGAGISTPGAPYETVGVPGTPCGGGPCGSGGCGNGGTGGSVGDTVAVNQNGYTLAWTAGNNATQVKGSVS
jgi:hypothetical protein